MSSNFYAFTLASFTLDGDYTPPRLLIESTTIFPLKAQHVKGEEAEVSKLPPEKK